MKNKPLTKVAGTRGHEEHGRSGVRSCLVLQVEKARPGLNVGFPVLAADHDVSGP